VNLRLDANLTWSKCLFIDWRDGEGERERERDTSEQRERERERYIRTAELVLELPCPWKQVKL
jgi:hypothetical protein